MVHFNLTVLFPVAEAGSHSALGAGRVKPIRARATGEEALTQRSQGKETRPGQVRVPFLAPPASCAFSVPHTVTSPVNGPQLLLAACRVIVCVPHLPRGLCSSPPLPHHHPPQPSQPTRDCTGCPSRPLPLLPSSPFQTVSVMVPAGNRWHVQPIFWKDFGRGTVDRCESRARAPRRVVAPQKQTIQGGPGSAGAGGALTLCIKMRPSTDVSPNTYF